MFNNKPWKEWKTRKTTLVFSIVFVVLYTVIGVVMGFYDKVLDSTLTEQIFEFFKWLTGTGCLITVSNIFRPSQDSLSADEEFETDGETEL